MLFFAQPVKIPCKANLGFDLFLAVTVVVVRDDRDDDAAVIAATDLESVSTVVRFIRITPAHPVALLPCRRFGLSRESQGGLPDPNNVGRNNDATRMAGPMR